MPIRRKINKSRARMIKMKAMTFATVAAPLATPLKPNALATIAMTTAAIEIIRI
jgi:hypothetical protein